MENQQTYKTLDQVIQGIDQLLDAVPHSSSRSYVHDVLDESAILHKFVLIGLGSLRIALPMDGLIEVGSLPVITPLPNLPSWVLGIVNVRSEILSVVDLAGFLDLPAARTRSADRFVIIRHKELRVGIPIERIYGTVSKSISEQNIPIFPEVKGEDKGFFAPGGFMVEEQLYSILDVKQLLSSHRFLNYHQTM